MTDLPFIEPPRLYQKFIAIFAVIPAKLVRAGIQEIQEVLDSACAGMTTNETPICSSNF